MQYHDEEWGVPERDAGALFELLNLEGMQAGLSWWTVLSKREHMRTQFYCFEPDRLVEEGPRDLERWLEDPGLIRHRGKLEAMITNAQAYLAVEDVWVDEIWSTVDYRPQTNRFAKVDEVPAKTAAAESLAKKLKQMGFKFVGPTTVYAFMQSAGLVNDHRTSCHWHEKCEAIAQAWSW